MRLPPCVVAPALHGARSLLFGFADCTTGDLPAEVDAACEMVLLDGHDDARSASSVPYLLPPWRRDESGGSWIAIVAWKDIGTSGATKAPVTRRMEVLSRPERRRRYSDEEKAALVAETFRPGVCPADLARRHGLHPQQLCTWRRQARRGEPVLRDEDMPMFAPVMERTEDGSQIDAVALGPLLEGPAFAA